MRGLKARTGKRVRNQHPEWTGPALTLPDLAPPPHTLHPLLLPQRALFSTLEISFGLGNKITINTDDFEGTCEPPDTLPQAVSQPPLCFWKLGETKWPRGGRCLCAGYGEARAGEVHLEEARVLR